MKCFLIVLSFLLLLTEIAGQCNLKAILIELLFITNILCSNLILLSINESFWLKILPQSY